MDDQEPIEAPTQLGPVPPALAHARRTLHDLAETVISPARREATGRIGLRAVPGGFGTPRFDGGKRVRVEGTDLVFDDPGGGEKREPVEVDRAAAAFLADWYAFGANVLLELRAVAAEGDEPSLIELWPEHFDIAVELGSQAVGSRATYGFSPGDDSHDEPYVYVTPWIPPVAGELWQACGFTGAELRYDSLRRAEDQRAAALEFLRERWRALRG